MVDQNLDALCGASGPGEYAVGQRMTFTEGHASFTGEILHVAAPQKTVSGRELPTSYLVDCGDGFPHTVISSQIDEGLDSRIAKLAQPSPRRHQMTFCNSCGKDTGRAAIETFDQATQRYILLPLYCDDCKGKD